MNRQLTIEVAGDPVAKGRPRVTKTGHAYTPAQTRRWEQYARLMAQQQMAGQAPIAGPVEVCVRAVFPVPASWPAWKRQMALAGAVGHTTKPDGDNLFKAAVDALNGIVFVDDSQIIWHSAAKLYGDKPRVEIIIAEVGAIPAQATKRPDAIQRE